MRAHHQTGLGPTILAEHFVSAARSLDRGRGGLGLTTRGNGFPPLRQLRGAPGESDGRELEKRARIDQAFEVNHFLDRLPVRSPAPLIEFGFIGLAKIELHVRTLQAQQEPTLLLPDTHRMLIPANVAGRQTVPQPASGAADKFDVISRHSDFFEQLGRMVDLDTLRNHGLRVLHEAMYGAGAGLIARALQGGSTTVEELHGERNPGFGGMHPEPIDRYMPEAMERMRSGRFDLGIANDGDADRVGIIDENGRYINQLQVMALFAMYLLEKRGLRGDIVRSITTSGMPDALGERFGVTVHEMPVGFKYIGGKMMETDAILGGEESGGYAFRGHIPERDGILSGLMMAAMIVDYGLPLSGILAHLEDLVGPHAYDRHDIRFPRDGYEERKEQIYARMQQNEPLALAGSKVVRTRSDDGYKFYLDDGSWVLMRMSGTEPLMRVYAEATTQERVEQLIAALENQSGVSERIAVGASE